MHDVIISKSKNWKNFENTGNFSKFEKQKNLGSGECY